ncbi:hypothetical protein ANCDUO_12899 [Ancylostoma duodenale]|uniref:Uncharacterized protein n=1 Tax=Ancylostoma duodenale TaxID=51022 RepID=A0A0C2CKC7_9BILA|nr:hypothetical protein ANCDUO_12899 [Ancylostoma duodenale]
MRTSDNRWTRAAGDWTPWTVKCTTGTDPMLRLLHEVQGKIQSSLCPSNKQNPLDNSGSRDGQMEGLVAPARITRKLTGVKVIKVIKEWMESEDEAFYSCSVRLLLEIWGKAVANGGQYFG